MESKRKKVDLKHNIIRFLIKCKKYRHNSKSATEWDSGANVSIDM